MHVVILQSLCHTLAYVTTANGVCLQLFILPLKQCCLIGASLVLLWCFFGAPLVLLWCFFGASLVLLAQHNLMYYSINRTPLREKHPLQQVRSKKLIFEGGPIFKIMVNSAVKLISVGLAHACRTNHACLLITKTNGTEKAKAQRTEHHSRWYMMTKPLHIHQSMSA